MADDKHEDDALENFEVGVVEDELRLPALEDARGAKDANELDQPQRSQRAQHAKRRHCVAVALGACARRERDDVDQRDADRDGVDSKPALEAESAEDKRDGWEGMRGVER
jgi:hypothetical protein